MSFLYLSPSVGYPNFSFFTSTLVHSVASWKSSQISSSNKNLNNLEVTKELLKNSKNIIKLGKKVKINFVKDRPGHDIRYALDSN